MMPLSRIITDTLETVEVGGQPQPVVGLRGFRGFFQAGSNLCWAAIVASLDRYRWIAAGQPAAGSYARQCEVAERRGADRPACHDSDLAERRPHCACIKDNANQEDRVDLALSAMGLLEGWVEMRAGGEAFNPGEVVTRNWNLDDLRKVLRENRATVIRIDRNRDGTLTPEHFVVVFLCGETEDIVWVYDPADENKNGDPETFGSLSERVAITHKYISKRLQ